MLFVFLSFQPVFSQDSKEMQMAKDEWQQIYDAYALRAILLIVKNDSLALEIDSLRTVDSLMTLTNKECMNEIYTLLGTDEGGIADYRRKFDETERIINNKTGTPADARKNYFDEISGSKIKCLSDFSNRYASMKKKMDEWEGIKTPEIVEQKPIEQVYSKDNTYTVVEGDNLRTISVYEYGSSDYWTLIWEANKNGIANKYYFFDEEHRYIIDPDLIYPGQVLYIPRKPE